MSKRETDIEILKHEITSLKHLVAEIKKDAVKKENDQFILSQMPTEEQQQVAALSKEIHRREAELKELIELVNQEAEAEEDAFMANLPESAKDILQLPSSGALVKKTGPTALKPDVEPATEKAAEETGGKAVKAPATDPVKVTEKEVSPVFRKLADPQLPELPSDDRARLQLQSPNRLFFYWSSRRNPYDNLQRLFGQRFSGYDLAIRLINLKDDSVRVMPADKSGTTWFDVSSDSSYRAELGFFSQNKPFIRVMYSNTIQTPRPSPSRRLASDADFAVRTTQFADVLSASGYAHENIAQNFAFADTFMADTRAREIAGRLSEKKEEKETFKGIDLAELRWVLVSLAAYIPLDELKMAVSPELIAWLEELQAENPNALKPESVSSELERSLGGEFVQSLKSGEIETRKRYVHKVFGGSAVDVFETFVPQLVEFPTPKEKTRHRFDAPTSPVK
jgi:hypothetical protein